MRVLMQNRPNTFSQRGGDTVVMEKTRDGLEKRGVTVAFDTEGTGNPADYDVVHLFNFATPQVTRHYAEQARAAGVPFVVTTLCEDIPSFHNQSIHVASHLIEYVRRGQDKNWYQATRPDISRIERCPPFDNRWVASHAACLLTNGSRESAVVKSTYGDFGNIHEVPLGYDIGTEGDPSLFKAEYGEENFVFCVGRIETRKNQLMLLRALEDSDRTLVLAAGGFSYQPDYDGAVRAFQRKGKTLILGRLSDEMLASAYAAAAVHVLPSWYELPGLVSLEAAYYGCQVVVTQMGTSPDYFQDAAFYCDPADERSIFNAIEEAFHAPENPKLKEIAMKTDWDKTAEKTLEAYTIATGIADEQTPTESVRNIQLSYDMSPGATEFQDMLEKGEMAARKKDFENAHAILAQAIEMNPESMRAHRAQGAVYLAESNVDEAITHFERAFQIDQKDPKTLSGIGMCFMMKERPADAYAYFVRALEEESDAVVTLLQLVECAYMLNRFDDLERCLRNYLKKKPDDIDMQFCLAGCLFKQGKVDESKRINDAVLLRKPDHQGGQELHAHMNASTPSEDSSSPSPVVEHKAAVTDAKKTVNVGDHIRALAEKRLETGAAAPTAASPTGSVDYGTELERLNTAKRHRDFEMIKSRAYEILNDSNAPDAIREESAILMAEVAVLEGDVARAETAYTEILKNNPSSARAICGQATLKAHRGDWAGAKAAFEQARSVQAEYDIALAGLGLCAIQEQQHQDAWAYFQRALTRNPENVRALLGVIELGYASRQYSDVEVAIKNYLDCRPGDIEFLYSLAGCYFAQNKLDEARQELDKIAIFKPDYEKAIELREMIEQKAGAGA